MKKSRIHIFALCAEAIMVTATALYGIFSYKAPFFPFAILLCTALCLVISIIILALELKSSMAETLYSYKNIALIGWLIFSIIFAVVIDIQLTFCAFSGNMTAKFVFEIIKDFPKHFSYYAVFVMIAVCLVLGISNISLIKHEGLCLHNALCLILAVFYIGGTFLVYFISYLLKNKVFVPRGITADPVFTVLNTLIPMFLLIMICYFECIFAATVILGWKAVRAVPKYDKDYIIILGCSIDKRGGLLPLLKTRVNRAIKFAWDQEIATGKPIKYIPSGGKGANEIMSEGSAMELYLLSHGAEDYEVMPEKASANTLENMKFSKKIIDGIHPGAKVAFSTTNYHILRSGIIAREIGLDAEGIAADTKWYFWPNGFIREFFGIIKITLKLHIAAAAIIAAVCAVISCVGFFANII